MRVQWSLMFSLASSTMICHWQSHFPNYNKAGGCCSRCTSFLYQSSWEICWCSQLYWGCWRGSCQPLPSTECHLSQPGLLRAHSLSRLLMTLTNHVTQYQLLAYFPVTDKTRYTVRLTMVTQGMIQSLVRQMGIFSMSLPMTQWLGSIDIIKLWLLAPNFLSTGRSGFKQLSSWLSHRQKFKTYLARNFTSLGYQPGS